MTHKTSNALIVNIISHFFFPNLLGLSFSKRIKWVIRKKTLIFISNIFEIPSSSRQRKTLSVKCYKDFFGYFNTIETHSVLPHSFVEIWFLFLGGFRPILLKESTQIGCGSIILRNLDFPLWSSSSHVFTIPKSAKFSLFRFSKR